MSEREGELIKRNLVFAARVLLGKVRQESVRSTAAFERAAHSNSARKKHSERKKNGEKTGETHSKTLKKTKATSGKKNERTRGCDARVL